VIVEVVRRTDQSFDIPGTVIKDRTKVILARVDGRECVMPGATRAQQIAKANGWNLAPRAPQLGSTGGGLR